MTEASEKATPIVMVTHKKSHEKAETGEVLVSLTMKKDPVADKYFTKRMGATLLDSGVAIPVVEELSVEHALIGKNLYSDRKETRLQPILDRITPLLTSLENSLQSWTINLVQARVHGVSQSLSVDEFLDKLSRVQKMVDVLQGIPEGESIAERFAAKIITLRNRLARLHVKLCNVRQIPPGPNPEIELDHGHKCTDSELVRADIRTGKRKLSKNDIGKCPVCFTQEISYEDLNARLGPYIVPYTRMLAGKPKICLVCGEKKSQESSGCGHRCERCTGACAIGCPLNVNLNETFHPAPKKHTSTDAKHESRVTEKCESGYHPNMSDSYLKKLLTECVDNEGGFSVARCPECGGLVDIDDLRAACNASIEDCFELVMRRDQVQKTYYVCKEHSTVLKIDWEYEWKDQLVADKKRLEGLTKAVSMGFPEILPRPVMKGLSQQLVEAPLQNPLMVIASPDYLHCPIGKNGHDVCRFCGESKECFHDMSICRKRWRKLRDKANAEPKLVDSLLEKEHGEEEKVVICPNPQCAQPQVWVGKRMFCCHCDKEITHN